MEDTGRWSVGVLVEVLSGSVLGTCMAMGYRNVGSVS